MEDLAVQNLLISP